MGRSLRAAALLAAGAFAAEAPSRAQEGSPASAPSVTSGDNSQVFEPSFFDRFNPITALDMVEQVPGFSLSDGDDRRGFGANAGNVLIDGERPSSSSGVSDELGRIPVERVLRVELLRGAQADADVRGQAQLVNVVLRAAEEGRQPGSFVAEAVLNDGGRMGWFAQANQSLRLFGADVTLGVEAPSDTGRSTSEELVTAPDGTILALRERFNQANWRGLDFTASARWRPGPRDAASLNVRFSPELWDGREQTIETDASGAPVAWEAGRSEDTDSYSIEVGGDWERSFSPISSIKLVGLVSYDQGHSENRYENFTTAGFERADLSVFNGSYGERIGRGAWMWRGFTGHSLEIGLEGAFTYSDNDLAIAVDEGAGPVPIDLPVAVTRVEELRGEAFVTDVWTVTPRLSIEAGLIFEASRITQTGDAEQERELSYPKPRAIATYALTPDDQLRFSLVRDVGQLDFGEFASTVSFSDDTVDIGNPDLEPSRSWQSRAEWERRVGERSAVTLSAFYDAYDSLVDLVVIGDFTGPGNIEDGRRFGVSADGTAALDAIGLSNALLRYEGTLQHTGVDDPITGESRPFAEEPEWSYRLEFRQDLPVRRLAWGFDFGQESEVQFHRADELLTSVGGFGNIDAFVETTRWSGVTVRLGVDNIFDAVDTTERFFYVDSRATGVIERQELRDRRSGQVYSVRVAGRF